MNLETMPTAGAKSDDEYRREIDRMAIEIRAMLDESRRSLERSELTGKQNARMLDELEMQFLCGKS